MWWGYYQKFAEKLRRYNKKIIILKSELSRKLSQLLPKEFYKIHSHLKEAIFSAYKEAREGEIILVSPAAAFFYTYFIKGKESLRRIITSLPPKGKSVEVKE